MRFFQLFICLLFSLILQSSCKNEKRDSVSIKIILPKTQIEQLKGQHLYLHDLSTRNIIDSTLINAESIIFNLKADTDFVPHLVFITHFDTFQSRPYQRPIGFKNPYKERNLYGSFYLDKGLTVIEPSNLKDSTILSSFSGSKQNEVYFKKVDLNYTADEKDPKQRQVIINRNISIIKTYSYSIHLLTELNNYKGNFLDTELKEQLNYFDSDVKKTKMFQSFTDYFAISATYDKAYPQKIQLLDTANHYQTLGDANAEYNLIVFWASWCGPCRAEIPELKELYKKYNNRGLVITSVSIDGESNNWRNALAQEKMPWQQLLVDDLARGQLDLQFNIKAIPKVYLFDKREHLIGVYEGNKSMLVNKIDMLFK